MLTETPHLTTAMTGPLHLLEKQILLKQHAIENWFRTQWQLSPAPVYGSVDLRNSGFKLAPVDMNLFPGGFNNLNPDFFSLSVEAATLAMQKIMPRAKTILLVPENHTRNLFYWENIGVLLRILTHAGFEVRVGSLLPDYAVPSEMTLKNGETFLLESITRQNDRIGLKNFLPDIILLNNDLSEGIPDILQNLSQPVAPPAELGWSQRLKSGHFQFYQEVSEEFASLIQIDPWLIAPLFRNCGAIDFMTMKDESGSNCLIAKTREMLSAIQKKYDEYQINCKPFVIIKADAGTYGMAVMTIRDTEELKSLNRKQRTAMSKSKGGQIVEKVIVQEGVYTFETWKSDDAIAEPVVYMWGERVVGGFYRVHENKGIDENLNAPGMKFEPLAFVKTCHKPADKFSLEECQNRFYAYGVIARLSMLAAAREMLQQT